jgi:hypothetical protein
MIIKYSLQFLFVLQFLLPSQFRCWISQIVLFSRFCYEIILLPNVAWSIQHDYRCKGEISNIPSSAVTSHFIVNIDTFTPSFTDWFTRAPPGLFQVKAIPVTDRGGPQCCETTSRFPHFLDNQSTDGGEVVTLTRRPPFIPQKDRSIVPQATSNPRASRLLLVSG